MAKKSLGFSSLWICLPVAHGLHLLKQKFLSPECSPLACEGIPRGLLTCAQEYLFLARLQAMSWKPQLRVPWPLLLSLQKGDQYPHHESCFLALPGWPFWLLRAVLDFPQRAERMPLSSVLAHIFLSCLPESRIYRISHGIPSVWGSPILTLVLKPNREQPPGSYAFHCPGL